ncbi:anti-sigma factor [Halobacillus litoralis]|nr:anti-sigma factor [Halobacillus litoralis]
MHNECDKVIDYFNDQLTEQEKSEFERHLESCDDCKEELAELQELTADLPFAADPVDPPSSMKDRVLGNVFAEEQPSEDDQEHETTPEKDKDKDNVVSVPVKNKRKRPWMVPALAAALLLSVAGNIYTIIQSENEVAGPVDEDPGEEEPEDQVLQRVQLQSEDNSMSGTAAMLDDKEEKLLVVQAENLTPLEQNEVYQVWLLKGDQPYPAGSFISNQNGEGAVAFPMQQLENVEGGEWDAVAISKEPGPNSQTPQGEVLMSAGL